MDRILQLAREAGRIADDKKAEDITILDLRNITTLTDSFVICSVTNNRQARAIAQEIEEKLAKLGLRLDHIEGYPDSNWILMDYTDLVVHIFTREIREYYDLEHLWGDAPRVELD
jgi:ribosome-associated protein